MDAMLRQARKGGARLVAPLVLLAVSGCAVHPTDLAERAYTNPVYRWSIAYPGSWTVDNRNPGFVKISSSSDEALCGIHSQTVASGTVDEFTNALERAPNRVTLARRKISLPNDVIGNDVLSRIVGGGKSRRIYVLADGRALGIDCESYEKDWDRLEPFYDRIIRSFTLLPTAKVTLVNPKTGASANCPTEFPKDGIVTRMITQEQAEQQLAWYREFQRTHNRLPTPMEGCIKEHEIRGFFRKPE